MQKARIFVIAFVFTTLYSGLSMAVPARDAAGKCRDNGKFVAASLCEAAAPPSGKCRDVKTKKFAKCGTANTEPVPTTGAK